MGCPRLCVMLVFSLLLFCPCVYAQNSGSQALDSTLGAEELKSRGNAAMDSGRPADALHAYELAYEVSQDPALLYNKGRAYQALTRYPEALVHVERFAREAPVALRQKVPGLGVLIDELKTKVTTIRIGCNVEGAVVRLRDRTLGTTPIRASLKVNAGPALLEASAEGYMPYSVKLVLAGAATIDLGIELMSRTDHGVIVVSSPKAGARARVDGVWRGLVPVEVTLATGEHQLELEKDGYEVARTSIFVEPGKSKQVSMDLSERSGLFSRWWFWTAAGVVAAATVSTIIAVNTERDPDTGTISPGRIVAGK